MIEHSNNPAGPSNCIRFDYESHKNDPTWKAKVWKEGEIFVCPICGKKWLRIEGVKKTIKGKEVLMVWTSV